jgi:hypothetical protein
MRAKRSQLISLIRQLRRAVVIEASGGEGEKRDGDVIRTLDRADNILRAENDDSREG